jgi:hypothetical protein
MEEDECDKKILYSFIGYKLVETDAVELWFLCCFLLQIFM